MTKHHEPNGQSAPQSDRICAVLQAFQGVDNLGAQIIQNPKHGLPLVGLSISKAYLERRLLIYVTFNLNIGREDSSIPRDGQCHARNAAAIFKGKVVDPYILSSGQQDHVFVSDVELVKIDDVLPIPTLVGLYDVKNLVNDTRMGGRMGVSRDGSLSALPVGRFCDGEFSPVIDFAAVGFHEDTVSVIQGGPEIVQRIAQNGGSVPWERPTDCASFFPELIVALRPDGFCVGTNVCPENIFEVEDVMFGPFGL